MPEAQYLVSGFNIAGLDPIEVPVTHPGAGGTATLTDANIGKSNTLSGNSAFNVVLPSAAGTLDGYSKAGRMIALRGASTQTGVATILPFSGQPLDAPALATGATNRYLLGGHVLVLVSTGSAWTVLKHEWPPDVGYVQATRTTNQALSANENNLVYDSIVLGNHNGWYNTTTGVYSPLLRGRYRFSVQMLLQAGTSTSVLIGRLLKNGVAVMNTGRNSSAAANTHYTFTSSRIFSATETDSFRPGAFTSIAATFYGTNQENSFEVEYVGP